MNWDKAKNLTIICLLILNICLLLLVYANNRKYITSQDEKQAIYNALSQKNITLNTPFIEKFQPMERIIMEQYEYDSNLLLETFFNTTDVLQTSEANKVLYTDGISKTLVIDRELVFYENYIPQITSKDDAIKEEKAIDLCDQFISENKELFPHFVLDRVIEVEDGYQLEYRQEYKDNIIYSNYAIISMNAYGDIKTVEYVLNPPQKFDNNPQEIISSDQALFIFVRDMANLLNGKPIVLESMDKVYYHEDQLSETGQSSNTIPCYRIYVKGYKMPILINAYTGNVENEF